MSVSSLVLVGSGSGVLGSAFASTGLLDELSQGDHLGVWPRGLEVGEKRSEDRASPLGWVATGMGLVGVSTMMD